MQTLSILTQKLRRDWLPLAVLTVAVIAVYWGITRTFFQQDEWQEMGLILAGKISLNPLSGASLWQILLGQGRYFSDLLFHIFFKLLPFNVGALAALALLLHLINVWLVYYFVRRLAQSPIIGFVAALFFALNAVSDQAVLWVATIATLPATTLILLSVNSYLTYLENHQRRWQIISFVYLLLSLFFKEVGIFLVLFLPLLDYLYSQRTSLYSLVKRNTLFLGYGLIVVIFRLATILTATAHNGAFITAGASLKEKLLVHLWLYPTTGLSQTLVPALPLYHYAKHFSAVQYPYLTTTAMAEIVPQTIITDLLTLVGTAVLIGLVVWANAKRQFKDSALISFSLAFVGLSFLPYIILDRGGSYLESRYYYLAAIGVGILLGYLVERLWQKQLWLKVVTGVLLVGLLAFHVRTIRSDLTGQIETARQRLAILNNIKTTVPTLGQRNVFYITGNRNFYIADNNVPFQQGVGYTLMVWYFDGGQVPASFLGDKFIWDIGTNGYKEENGRGFGFFSSPAKLKEALAANQFSLGHVKAFYWDADNQLLTDQTASLPTLLR